MSDLVAVAVVDLKAGPALDWAVAKAIGLEVKLTTEFASLDDGGQRVGMCCFPVNGRRPFKPSTDWAQGGTLIDQFEVFFMGSSTPIGDGKWHTRLSAQVGTSHTYDGEPASSGWKHNCNEHLPAAMQAIVAAKFGDAVTVPRELVKTK